MAALRGRARFGMDDGYMVGPPEVVFDLLSEFAAGLKAECGCELNINKCKMYNMEKGACERARRRGLIPEELQHLHEGTFVNESGHILRGIQIFIVSIETERYVAVVLREKAKLCREPQSHTYMT